MLADVSYRLLTKAVTTSNHTWAQPITPVEIPEQLVTVGYQLRCIVTFKNSQRRDLKSVNIVFCGAQTILQTNQDKRRILLL